MFENPELQLKGFQDKASNKSKSVFLSFYLIYKAQSKDQ